MASTVAGVARVRRLWIGVIAAVVLAVAAAYLLVSLNYQLEHGDTWNVGEGAVFEESDREVAFHELRAGNKVQIAITVRNAGALRVTLGEVAIDGADVVVDEVTMNERAGQDPHSSYLARDGVAFHPVELRSGDQVMVWLTLRVTGANPYPPCAGLTLESANLRYDVMGLARSQRLLLRTKIAFRAPCQSS
jgi:hypothetical protein